MIRIGRSEDLVIGRSEKQAVQESFAANHYIYLRLANTCSLLKPEAQQDVPRG
jgi:hypothetical protein